MVEVISNSSFANFSQFYADPQTGEKYFEWRMWDAFLQSRFKRIQGIREVCQMRLILLLMNPVLSITRITGQ
jgi:hypothetical protein